MLIALSGCVTVGPDYTPPKISTPASWQDTKRHSENFNSERPKDFAVWWRQLGDPVLSELIEKALKVSPDMKTAKAKLRESRARLGTRNSALYPTISAVGDASRTKSGITQKQYNLGFDVSWEIDFFGGTRRAVEAATADFQATAADLSDVQVTLIAEVARNYANYRNTQNRIAIAQKNLDSQSNTLEITSWQAQAGLVSSLDVEQARTNREQTRAQIPSLQTTLFETAHRLAVLLGEQPGALNKQLANTTSSINVPPTLAVGIPADILRQRPDIRSAERKLAAETARIGEAEAALYPSTKLTGSIGITALTLHGLKESATKTNSILASISAAIFNAGKLREEIKLQTSVQEQAFINYQKTLLVALEEVENALVSLSGSRERVAALEIAVGSARNAVLLAHNQYSAGLVDFQTVLSTERSLLTVEDSLANAQNDEVISLITLYKALGGGWMNVPSESSSEETNLPKSHETSND